MKGQLSSCRTSSTVSCSQADSSWTPWFLPEERRLDEDEAERAEDEGGRTGLEGLEGLGGGVTSWGGGRRGERFTRYWCLNQGPVQTSVPHTPV